MKDVVNGLAVALMLWLAAAAMLFGIVCGLFVLALT